MKEAEEKTFCHGITRNKTRKKYRIRTQKAHGLLVLKTRNQDLEKLQ